MKKDKKIQREKIGGPGYINKNCWLAKTLNYSPYSRCQYCELEFRKCLFLQYQIISLALIGIFLILFFLTERKITALVIICVFTFVIVYGYVLNKSTDRIIKANFAQRKASQALEELTEKLEERVKEQTEDIKKKAAELEEKNTNLNKLLEVKNEFLRVVNHQLNTPVSIIKNSIFMIKSGAFSLEKGLSFVDEGVKRMEEIFTDFWKAFSFEGEGVKLDLRETNLEEIIGKLVDNANNNSPVVKERGLKVEVEKNFDIPRIKSDPKQITQVASNLLENAISYTNSGSVAITFGLIGNEFLKIYIQDSGCGIDFEDQGKLFEKFVRGKRAVHERPSGSGLGLYIAKKIVEANGGELKLEKSEVGKGSMFSFTVPIWR
ncbi:MAG: HAMP domain-containing sensor histidine kinase [Patescibacteria group bacterium]|nr:HAMP domain-containing sensor histidine kinase [Patescibacteria group bacterium]